MIRKPAVAGYFYPDDKRELFNEIERYLKPKAQERDAIGVVSPHAGYIYSGEVAGNLFSAIRVPDTVIVMGPNHTGLGAEAAIVTSGKWQIPGAEIEIDSELANLLIKNFSELLDDSSAHLREHSLEVQLPFIYYKNKNFKLVPICLAHKSYSFCADLGEAIAEVLKKYSRPTLIVASSDMTHYEPHEIAKSKDQLAIDKILNLSPKNLYNTVINNRISMCGVIPVVTMLCAALSLGAKKAEIIQYKTSGETSGDFTQVVGYAGIVVS